MTDGVAGSTKVVFTSQTGRIQAALVLFFDVPSATAGESLHTTEGRASMAVVFNVDQCRTLPTQLTIKTNPRRGITTFSRSKYWFICWFIRGCIFWFFVSATDSIANRSSDFVSILVQCLCASDRGLILLVIHVVVLLIHLINQLLGHLQNIRIAIHDPILLVDVQSTIIVFHSSGNNVVYICIPRLFCR